MKYVIFKSVHRATGQYFIGKVKSENLKVFGFGAFGTGSAILALVKQHGVEAFDRTILKEFDDGDEAVLFKNQHINADDPLCLNIRKTGDLGREGMIQPPQARAKISKANTGRKHNKFIRGRCQEIMMGRQHLLGHVPTQSTRDAIGLGNKKAWKRRKQAQPA